VNENCKWRRVSSASPCPICNHPDWCSGSADGRLAACRRVEAGCWKSKTDKNGAPYHLHCLADPAWNELAPPPRPPGPGAERAGPYLLHRAYSSLLARLSLAKAHREALCRRGLTGEEIDRRGYRTFPAQGRAGLARALREELGDALLTVPGFVMKPGEGGRPYLTIAGSKGLLVPVRDPASRVVALLVRRDEAKERGGKYAYLSSAKYGGPSPGAPPHVPLGVGASCPTCRLTEGALKADVAAALSGLPTVGAAGLAWRPALDVARELGAAAVRLAFDADAPDKVQVARALSDCCAAAGAAGLAVELERWDKADGKGIDDLLAGGKAPEVLAGEAALAAARETLAAATVGACGAAPDELGRLAVVLAEGGAPALFADRPLLQALARLAAADPAAYAARRATLKGLVSLRDLDAALKPFIREQARERPPVVLADGGYRVEGGRLCREHGTPDGGAVLVPLCNFAARITEVVTRDDGAEQTVLFTVAGTLADGRSLRPVPVTAADFGGLGWVTGAWHGEAIVFAGLGTRDHLRTAIELLSPDRARRTVYAHTGWRRIGEGWFYLHAGGAIGAGGSATGIEVSLPDALAGLALPATPSGEAQIAAVRASLGMLRLGPDRLTFPLLAAAYRAALGATDFALHLAGPTGTYKTEAAALAQQHFGPELDARHLPAGWSSTGNALEGLAFVAKDSLLVVDDFCPVGSVADVQRYHREADRLLRAQGNHAGRQRMRADATLRPSRPPRGLTVSTGEDVPRGQSLRARLLVMDVTYGDLGPKPPAPNPTLTACQQDAAAGKYAAAMAGFVRWLAPQYEAVRGRLAAETASLRDSNRADGQHARTAGIVADLAFGLHMLLEFALRTGAINEAERADLWRRGLAALREAAGSHATHAASDEPAVAFLALIVAALASGRAHVASPMGEEPDCPERWGWRREEVGTGDHATARWRPQGKRIGWVGEDGLFLEPNAAHAEAQQLAAAQGASLPVTPQTLRRRLKDEGLLATTDDKRQKLTVRRTLERQRREVLHIPTTALAPPAGGIQDSPTPGDGASGGPAPGADPVTNGPVPQDHQPAVTPSPRIGNGDVGRLGRSGAGEEAGAGVTTGSQPSDDWSDWQ
jgi:hypothetical protein